MCFALISCTDIVCKETGTNTDHTGSILKEDMRRCTNGFVVMDFATEV